MADLAQERVTALWREAAETLARFAPEPERDSRRFHIRREDLREGSALDVDPPFASLDVVLRQDHEAECGRLQEQLDAARQALRAVAALDPSEWHHGSGWKGVAFIQNVARVALGVVGEQE